MSHKVLIVEDDKNLAESLKSLFISKKIDVRISSSGQEAEQIITLEQYDLLLVDVILPKMNGIVLIKRLISKGLLHSQCKIWLISGVLKKNIISQDIMSHVDDFMEKPLNLRSVEKKLNSLFAHSKDLLKKMNFFYLRQESEGGNVLKNKEYIIKGHELMFICFYLYSARFNGLLSVYYHSKGQKDELLFHDGKINSFKTEDKTSYLGVLLIKHNLVSRENIQKLVDEKNDKFLGDQLVDGCYISPHQLNRILKEQLAIRLFKTMEQPSIVVSCQDFTISRQFNQFVELEIRDYLALVNNWIHSKVSTRWLKGFFKNCEYMRVAPVKSLVSTERLARYSKMNFFTHPIKSPTVIVDLLKSQNEMESMRELYCRLLVRDLVIESTPHESTANMDYEFMRKKYQAFLQDANKKTYFELMNLPINAPVQKVEEVYKLMVKIFHPDRRNKDMPPDLIDTCDQCFILIRKIYQTLTDPAKRQAYLKSTGEALNKQDFVVKEMYMKGKKNLTEGHYASALSQLESILTDRTAPGDTVLYYISARLKSTEAILSPNEQEEIGRLFDNVGLEYRQSAMFYCTKGLFKKATKNTKSAFEFFTKAILLDPTLQLARVERHSLGQTKQKKKSTPSLFGLFRKGA